MRGKIRWCCSKECSDIPESWMRQARRTISDPLRDAGHVSDYAVESINALFQAGIIQGSGNFLHSSDKTNRAEAAVSLFKASRR